MKFLEITFVDPEIPGGVERFAFQLGQFLSNHSIDVTYIFSGDKEQVYVHNGIKKIMIKCNRKLFPKIFFNIKVYFYVKKHRLEYDIVHINGDNGDLIARIRGIKTLMTVHGSALKEGLSGKNNKALKIINKLNKIASAYISHIFEIYGMKRAGIIVSTSPAYIDFINLYRNKDDIVVIPLGVDTDFFKPGEKNEIRKELSMNLDALYGIWVGQDRNRKKLEFAIDVIEKTKSNLICIGDTNTDKKVSNKIILLKNISDKYLLEYYQASDFFLFPSKYEGFGLAILEAMACGSVPIIDQNIKIPVLSQGTNCFIAERDSDYFNIITTIENNRSILSEMSKEAVKSAGKLSVTNNLFRYLDIIDHYYKN